MRKGRKRRWTKKKEKEWDAEVEEEKEGEVEEEKEGKLRKRRREGKGREERGGEEEKEGMHRKRKRRKGDGGKDGGGVEKGGHVEGQRGLAECFVRKQDPQTQTYTVTFLSAETNGLTSDKVPSLLPACSTRYSQPVCFLTPLVPARHSLGPTGTEGVCA